MAVEIITKQDLQQFKSELLDDIKQIIRTSENAENKQWLKSSQVRQLLKISPGTLQNLRINGTLTFTKIGGTLYYSYDDIVKLLEANKQQNR